jgi:Secretion system C-terminal sorting domain
LVLSDTVFTHVEDGCFEITVTAHILTEAMPGLANLRQFTIAPNPAAGHLTLSGSLATGAFCEAKLLDTYGRTVMQCFENEWIAGGFSRRVDLRDVPPGLYFVCFAMDGERQVRKVVVE